MARTGSESMFFKWLFLSAVLLSLFGCGPRQERNPIPRRTAYPRVEAYDSLYRRVPQVDGLNVELNASCLVTVPRDSADVVWIDASYPRYKAVLHLTVNRASGKELADIIRNREERFARDTDGSRVSVTNVYNDISEIWIGRGGGLVTPLHIMATDGETFVLSGALELKGAPATLEEVSPVVDAVYDDLVHLGRNLRLR